jgi:hypothetical protein
MAVRARQYPRLFIDSGDYWLNSSNTTFQEALNESRLSVVFTKSAFVLGHLLFWMLAVYGIYTQRERLVQLGHLMLFPVFLVLVQLPMWVETRYSLPIIPLVAIMASAGALHLFEHVRSMERAGATATRVGSPSPF